jgi:O-antigen/teichoic acid export membrane protein
MTVANVMGGALGYAYQVLMGRLLTPAEFALFSAVLALGLFFGSPMGALFMVVSRQVSTLLAQGGGHMLRTLYVVTHKRLAVAGGCFLILLVLLIPALQRYLKSPDSSPVWLFGLFLVLSALLLVNGAFFQGLNQFFMLGGTGFVAVLMKIVFSVGLISLGLGVNGALAGVLLSVLSIWVFGMARLLRTLPASADRGQLSIKPFAVAAVTPVIVANVAFMAMTQLDMVLVNYYFPPDMAGLYAAASVLGKAVLYLPGGLVLALFPAVAENHAMKKGSSHLLFQSVAATFALCGMAALFYWFLGDQLISFFYGPAYSGAGELLRWYGFAILPMALVMVAEHFLIAQGRIFFAWLFLAIAPFQIAVIHLWHDEIWMVVAAIGGGGLALMCVGYAFLWRDYRSQSNVPAELSSTDKS